MASAAFATTTNRSSGSLSSHPPLEYRIKSLSREKHREYNLIFRLLPFHSASVATEIEENAMMTAMRIDNFCSSKKGMVRSIRFPLFKNLSKMDSTIRRRHTHTQPRTRTGTNPPTRPWLFISSYPMQFNTFFFASAIFKLSHITTMEPVAASASRSIRRYHTDRNEFPVVFCYCAPSTHFHLSNRYIKTHQCTSTCFPSAKLVSMNSKHSSKWPSKSSFGVSETAFRSTTGKRIVVTIAP